MRPGVKTLLRIGGIGAGGATLGALPFIRGRKDRAAVAAALGGTAGLAGGGLRALIKSPLSRRAKFALGIPTALVGMTALAPFGLLVEEKWAGHRGVKRFKLKEARREKLSGLPKPYTGLWPPSPPEKITYSKEIQKKENPWYRGVTGIGGVGDKIHLFDDEKIYQAFKRANGGKDPGDIQDRLPKAKDILKGQPRLFDQKQLQNILNDQRGDYPLDGLKRFTKYRAAGALPKIRTGGYASSRPKNLMTTHDYDDSFSLKDFKKNPQLMRDWVMTPSMRKRVRRTLREA